jgi:HAMP domain-containing protein
MSALPWPRSPASIRTRLVLLVLAVWIPAAIGLALQTRDAYRGQERSAREDLRQLALALNFAVESELDRRQVLAQALAASPSLRARDIPGFDRQARMAVQGTGLNAMLVDRTHQHLFTGRPERRAAFRGPDAFFVEKGAGVVFVAQGPVTRRPNVALFVPEAGMTSPRYNVGVTFPPAELQALLARQRYPEGGVAAVIDNHQRVMGRSRDPERWLGVQSTHPQLRELARTGGGGFIASTTLDGVASLTFLAPSNRHGWSALVAMPQATLRGAAGRLAAQAVAVSALLLAIGLVVALWVARRISRPVRQLERAGEELLAGRVPEPLRTGLSEIDRVGAVLHDAGLRSRESERLLESRVQQAVAEAREAEARLFEARKHEVIGRLTGGVAHDFNNLLQTMSMGMEVVQRSVPEGRHSKPLQAALAACGKAAGVVRQMGGG